MASGVRDRPAERLRGQQQVRVPRALVEGTVVVQETHAAPPGFYRDEKRRFTRTRDHPDVPFPVLDTEGRVRAQVLVGVVARIAHAAPSLEGAKNAATSSTCRFLGSGGSELRKTFP